MAKTVADTIRDLTREHLEKRNSFLFGQCITAVGWIQNTVPPHAQGLVELPMNDVSGPGIAIGTAIMGHRPILVLRFQSFLWLAASPIVNHAAKAKELFGYPAPILIRAIATEGDAAGPVHTGCYHSMFAHMPGIPVCAPMTPGEYEQVWDRFLKHDDPLLVSEHRRSYLSSDELPDQIQPGADITIYPISAARFNIAEAVALLAKSGIKCNVIHTVWLKPFAMTKRFLEPLRSSGCGLVVDSTYETASCAQSIAYDLMLETGLPVKALGMFDRSPGVSRSLENGTPSAAGIAEAVKQLLAKKKGRA